jgi:hypothetical protein
MSYVATTKKCLPRILSVRHNTTTKNPCVLVLTRCHVTDINHVLTPCHVIEINYVDRGVAARTPLQFIIVVARANDCIPKVHFACRPTF